jgi:hypothetical protein
MFARPSPSAALILVVFCATIQFELEVVSYDKTKQKRNKLFWLTFHIFVHIIVIVLSHCTSSWYPTAIAIFSQVMLLLLFLR